MPSIPLDRRASNCWNQRFGSDGSTESCCNGCGESEKLRCGVPTYLVFSREMMFSTRVVWLTNSRRSWDASRDVLSTDCDTPRSLAISVDVLRADPPTENKLGITGIGIKLVNPADTLELDVCE